MPPKADVRSLDALRDAKHALVEFRDVARTALSEATADVQRTLAWLQHDRRMYWQAQLRRRTELVAQAKSDLYRAKLSAMDDRAACTEQRKALERAERALEEARRKIEAVKRWAMLIDREFMLFKGKIQPMARAVDGDLPKGEARLDLLLERLESYIRLQAPQTGDRDRRAESAPEGEGTGEGTGDGAESTTEKEPTT